MCKEDSREPHLFIFCSKLISICNFDDSRETEIIQQKHYENQNSIKKALENINDKNPEQTQTKSIPLRLDIDIYSTHSYSNIISNFEIN